MHMLFFYCGNYNLIPPDEKNELQVISQVTENGATMTQRGVDLLEQARNSDHPMRVYSNIEHVFNGLRIAIMNADSLSICKKVHVIHTNDDSTVLHCDITTNGRVHGGYPDGLFDQNLKNQIELGRGRQTG